MKNLWGLTKFTDDYRVLQMIRCLLTSSFRYILSRSTHQQSPSLLHLPTLERGMAF